MGSPPRQPPLHDLLICLQAPTQFWSAPDGQLTGRGVEGVFHADTRVLSQAVLTVSGAQPENVMSAPDGPGRVRLVSLARNVDAAGADPTVRLERIREVRPGFVRERIVLTCAPEEAVTVDVRLTLGCDLAALPAVKGGGTTAPLAARRSGDGFVWSSDTASCTVAGLPDGVTARLLLDDEHAPQLCWDGVLVPGRAVELGWQLHADDKAVVVVAPDAAKPLEWSVPTVAADDHRLAALVSQSLDDLRCLRMATTSDPDDTFLAAGAPWFFTLFGRDSIWAARMLLPLGTALAGGTLRVLARRQGEISDPVTAEQPGKILHEVRSGSCVLDERLAGLMLPPVYYGTVDATPLWICLLHDAWRWGLPEAEVAALLPHLERALIWMRDHGDSDGDGFLEYVDASGRGLANQGWKDSGDSVRWRDGSVAKGPIALCEVQGYAYEAAVAGADLLDAFGSPDADQWRAWAARLADRFRAAFWVDGPAGPHPAIALDADKRPVDSLTSNIGHVLGTGLVDEHESAEIAARLHDPVMDTGFGLRTMSSDSGGYWPLRYHGGAVWPHDTAITIAGLSHAGHVTEAASLVKGLLAAAPAFCYRLPELFGGDARSSVPAPVPYPAACRPQAWSAAASVAILVAVLGISPDVPGGTLTVRPATPSPVGAVRAEGLRVAAADFTVEVSADGALREVEAPSWLTVR